MKTQLFNLRCQIGNFLFSLGFKPKSEMWGNPTDISDMFGTGYFKSKNKSAYHYGCSVYLFPVTNVKYLEEVFETQRNLA